MEEIDLKDFLVYLKKFIVLTIFVLAGALVGTYLYDTQFKTPMYSSYTTVVLAQQANSNSAITQSDITVNQKLVSTYSEIVKSKLVLQQTIDQLGLDMSYEQLQKNVSVKSVEDTEIIRITVADADQNRTAEITNKIAENFIKEVQGIYDLNNVSVIDQAQTPNQPSNNTLTRDLAIAAIIAVFGVIAIAFIIFYFDDTVKFSEDLEKKIGMPIAGKIIKSDVRVKDAKSELINLHYPKSLVSESIKSLRTNLQFANVDKSLKTVLITSSLAGEGKSFVAINLAISFAQAGKKVLLVDCDLRKGRLHKVFDVPNVLGLSNLLTDNLSNSSKYIQKTGVKELSLITRGAFPPNPSELLGSKKNKDLIEALKKKYDVIIFDGAPCNGVTDSVIMSTLVDEVLIVTKDTTTPRNSLNATKEMLEKVDAPIAGIVMNCVNKKVAKYYNYYGDYGHGKK
jgi:capsular exopolysaccharide family